MAISNLFRRAGNEALSINTTVATIDITTAGSDFLWMVFSVMAATTIGVGIWSQLGAKTGERTFYHLSMMVTATASIAYFCMASDLGAVAIPVEFLRGSYPPVDLDGGRVTRSIWYARYIDWTITTPLLLLELLLVTGLPLSDIVVTIFFDIVMIEAGLIGALVQSTYKWGLYSFGCVAMLYVFYMLYFPGRASARIYGDKASKAYLTGALLLSGLWFQYAICWGLADGGNVISPDGEMVYYGILDLLAKPVFTIAHIYAMRGVDYTQLGLSSGKHSEFALNGDVPASHTHGKTTGTSPTEKAAEGTHNASGGSPTAGAESTVGGH